MTKTSTTTLTASARNVIRTLQAGGTLTAKIGKQTTAALRESTESTKRPKRVYDQTIAVLLDAGAVRLEGGQYVLADAAAADTTAEPKVEQVETKDQEIQDADLGAVKVSKVDAFGSQWAAVVQAGEAQGVRGVGSSPDEAVACLRAVATEDGWIDPVKVERSSTKPTAKRAPHEVVEDEELGTVKVSDPGLRGRFVACVSDDGPAAGIVGNGATKEEALEEARTKLHERNTLPAECCELLEDLRTGWILRETAPKAFELTKRNQGARPVAAKTVRRLESWTRSTSHGTCHLYRENTGDDRLRLRTEEERLQLVAALDREVAAAVARVAEAHEEEDEEAAVLELEPPPGSPTVSIGAILDPQAPIASLLEAATKLLGAKVRSSDLAAELGRARNWTTKAVQRGSSIHLGTLLEAVAALGLEVQITVTSRDERRAAVETAGLAAAITRGKANAEPEPAEDSAAPPPPPSHTPGTNGASWVVLGSLAGPSGVKAAGLLEEDAVELVGKVPGRWIMDLSTGRHGHSAVNGEIRWLQARVRREDLEEDVRDRIAELEEQRRSEVERGGDHGEQR